MSQLMDELTFRSYVHQRMMFPDVQPERWAAIFQNVPAMEERFLKTFIAKVMQEIEVADQATGSAPVIDRLQFGDGGEVEWIPASPLQSSQVTALSLGYSGPFAEIPVIDQSLEARKLICGLSQGDTALMRVADTQEVASPSSLPVPLGREVSGEQRSHCENMVQGVKPFATVPVQFESGYCDGSPADQIFSYFPLAEIVEKVFKQRSFLCN